MGRICPGRFSLCERAAGGTPTIRAISICEGIDDQSLRAAEQQLLAELLDPGVRQTRTDCYLGVQPGTAGSPHESPAFRQQWTSLEMLEIGLVIGLDGN